MTLSMPPRCWIVSDLHQEHEENQWDMAAHAPAGGFDVAVVAGDVHVPLTRSLNWLAERLPGVPVVYVPGTQTHPGATSPASNATARPTTARLQPGIATASASTC